MKRVIISILGGIFLPIILTLLALLITWLLPQNNLETIYINGNPAPGLILAPIAIPMYIYIYFSPSINYHPVFGTFLFRTIWFFGFDFILYALLTYLLISYFGWFKPKGKVDYSAEPPPAAI